MMAESSITALAGRDQFLRLFIAQLKAQDPLDPVKDQEFTAQLAQFSTLEGIEKLNANFADMLALQQITQGAGLLGRQVSYANGSQVRQGVVQGFAINEGRLNLQVAGETVPIGQVTGMIAA